MLYQLLPTPPESFFKKNSDFNPLILTLLWQRGVKHKKEIQEFLHPVYPEPPKYRVLSHKDYDPFKFKEMELVVRRILKAAQNKERVLVYGDYDVDGVCSIVLMIETLEKLYGIAAGEKIENLIQVYLPHREAEGYGLNKQAVEYIQEQRIKLLITCDCGSTNLPELKTLTQAKIDVIVIDHHVAPKKRPPIFGFINAKFARETYPFRELAACGAVFKVVQALRIFLSQKQRKPLIGEAFEKWSLDLVALATVADVMPLLEENRLFVKWGLIVLNKTRRVGLQSLIQVAGVKKKIDSYEIGYILGPRINAAGRIDHANIAFDLLRQTSQQKALKEAVNLNNANIKRQKLTEKIFNTSREQVQSQLKDNDRVLVAYNFKKNEWPIGIIGLVAGKLAQEFNRPAFVIGVAEHGLVASGRSIKKFDIMAGLNQIKELFSKYGGHPQACGLTFIKQKARKKLISKFKLGLEKYARERLADNELISKLPIAAELKLAEITWDFIHAYSCLEPFGEANPKPFFLSRQVQVLSRRSFGINGDHIKLTLQQNGNIKTALAFRGADRVKGLKHNDLIDIIYKIEINEWQKQKFIQLIIKEVDKIKDGAD